MVKYRDDAIDKGSDWLSLQQRFLSGHLDPPATQKVPTPRALKHRGE